MEHEIPYKIYLQESEIPRYWYNLRADMKNKPAPLLDPQTGKALDEEALSHIFATSLLSRSWMTRQRMWKFQRRLGIFMLCIGRRQRLGLIVLKKL